MEKLLLLMVMLATCCAAPQDLSGRVFVFPKDSNIDRVKLLTTQSQFSALTVCLRFQTDLTREYGLLSFATPTHSNAFVLCKLESGDVATLDALDVTTTFQSLSLPPNTWHSVCATWRSDNGLAQLWVDGKATVKRYIQSGVITGIPITTLGQEQDSYGGGFNENQSFIGMITKVHMWNYVVPAAEIKRYMAGGYFTPGNVYNWRALEYEITGQVLVEEESEVM